MLNGRTRTFNSKPFSPRILDRSKRSSNKAASEEGTGSVPSGYVEDAFEMRTQLEVVFSGLLKVPGDAAKKHPRIARHDVNVVDRRRLVPQLRFKGEYSLFPFRVEQVPDK
jgi:hypothetical protein